MAQTVSRSGVPFQMARDISKTVSKKIKKESSPRQQYSTSNNRKQREQVEKATVTSGRIRKLVANELRDRNRTDIASPYSDVTPENTMQEQYQNVNEKEEPIIDNVAANKNKVMYDKSKSGGGIPT